MRASIFAISDLESKFGKLGNEKSEKNDVSQFKVCSMEGHVVDGKIRCNAWAEA